MDRVWFSPDGARLFARTPSGLVFATSDFERWTRVERYDTPPEPRDASREAVRQPESNLRVAVSQVGRSMYGAGGHAWRSDDGGATWGNLTDYRSHSILGGRLSDVAVAPGNVDHVVVSGVTGIWRSLDGGLTWTGVNDKLPNLPVHRLFGPSSDSPLTFEARAGSAFSWRPGQKSGWRPAVSIASAREHDLRNRAAASVQQEITAAAAAGDHVYAASVDGRLHASTNRGETWRPAETALGGRVERIITQSSLPTFALAITAASGRGRILRTVNGGLFWEDITANLAPGRLHGIAADRATGAVYVASDSGVYLTYTDTVALGAAAPWTLIRPGLASDVALDENGNQIYAAFDGEGIVATLAPHRLRDPRVVSAADRLPRAAAPGALISVLGAKVQGAQASGAQAAVLVSGETASELQLPYELPSGAVVLSIESTAGRMQVGLPVLPSAPGILLDRDANPMILNADSGLVLDSVTPARSGARLQIFATGLGQVSPAWPMGLAAPLDDPPKVVANVQVMLGSEALEVTRAALAPGYVGLYLVEVQLPSVVDSGTAELFIQAGGVQSNRVRLLLEP